MSEMDYKGFIEREIKKEEMLRRAFKFLRSTNAVCTCMRIKEGTEEDFNRNGSV